MNSVQFRQAFTLIEFIFIIIIITLLATIAIPKFAATRMDAKLSTKAQNIMVAANEIASYAVAKGHTEANLSKISNSIESMMRRGEATAAAPYRIHIRVEDIDDCIVLKVDGNGTNTETLVIEYGSTTSHYCDRLRSLVDMEAFPMMLHGNLVEY